MSAITMPIHPVTGVRAIGFTRRGPVWPVLGGAEDAGHPSAGDSAAGDGSGETPPTDPKPTETVEFWKQKAREQEKRAKDNASAAKRLAEIEDAQKSETQRAADKVAAAEAEIATIPAKVADALRGHLVALHKIDSADAELFLTATDPDLLLKQVERLVAQADKSKKRNHVPREGNNPEPGENSMHAFARQLFHGGE